MGCDESICTCATSEVIREDVYKSKIHPNLYKGDIVIQNNEQFVITNILKNGDVFKRSLNDFLETELFGVYEILKNSMV